MQLLTLLSTQQRKIILAQSKQNFRLIGSQKLFQMTLAKRVLKLSTIEDECYKGKIETSFQKETLPVVLTLACSISNM